MRFLRATPLLDENDPRFVTGTPEQQKQARAIAIGPKLSEELFDHRGRTGYAGDDEFVFCHPDKGSVLDHKRYAGTFRDALTMSDITDRVRPFHDWRHSAITHEAASGSAPAAIQARAGHADFSTTQRYINPPASSSAMRRCVRRPGFSALGYRIRVPSESMACRYLLRNPPISSD